MLGGIASVASIALAAQQPPNKKSDNMSETKPDIEHRSFTQQDRYELQINKALASPFTARAACYGLLMVDENSTVFDIQKDSINTHCDPAMLGALNDLLPAIKNVSEHERLMIIERAMPALKQMSASQYKDFHKVISDLVKADGVIELFEWCLYRVLTQYLNAHFQLAKPKAAKYGRPAAIRKEIETVISYATHYAVAHHGASDYAAQDRFEQAVLIAGFEGMSLQPLPNGLKPLNLALKKLEHAYPHVKSRVLKALIRCDQQDPSQTEPASDFVRSVAVILESPLPMTE